MDETVIPLLALIMACVLFSAYFCHICSKRLVRNHVDPEAANLLHEPVGELMTVSDDLTNECAICLDNFNAGEQLRVLDCGHYYHQQCVDPWLEKGKNCPKCRGENMV